MASLSQQGRLMPPLKPCSPEDIESFAALDLALRSHPELAREGKKVLNTEALARLVDGIRNFQDAHLGRQSKSMHWPLVRIPDEIFRDRSRSGPLFTALLSAYRQKSSSSWRSFDFASPKRFDDNVTILQRIERDLTAAGFLRRPAIFVDETVPKERRVKLGTIVEKFGGTVVTDPAKASHVVALDPEVDLEEHVTEEERRDKEAQDPEKLYLRTVTIFDPAAEGATGADIQPVAMVHWWYWPPSHDEWMPASDVSPVVEAEAQRSPGLPWVVSYKFIRDVAKHNEWGLEADYAIPDFQTKVALYKSNDATKTEVKTKKTKKGSKGGHDAKAKSASHLVGETSLASSLVAKIPGTPSGGLSSSGRRDRRAGIGMNPRQIVTGWIGPKGTRIRRTVHDGALRVPQHASTAVHGTIEAIVSGWADDDKNTVLKKSLHAQGRDLPSVDSVVRPTMDGSSGPTVLVTELFASPSGGTIALNRRVPVISSLDDKTERIRGGGDDTVETKDEDMKDVMEAPSGNDNASADVTMTPVDSVASGPATEIQPPAENGISEKKPQPVEPNAASPDLAASPPSAAPTEGKAEKSTSEDKSVPSKASETELTIQGDAASTVPAMEPSTSGEGDESKRKKTTEPLPVPPSLYPPATSTEENPLTDLSAATVPAAAASGAPVNAPTADTSSSKDDDAAEALPAPPSASPPATSTGEKTLADLSATTVPVAPVNASTMEPVSSVEGDESTRQNAAEFLPSPPSASPPATSTGEDTITDLSATTVAAPAASAPVTAPTADHPSSSKDDDAAEALPAPPSASLPATSTGEKSLADVPATTVPAASPSVNASTMEPVSSGEGDESKKETAAESLPVPPPASPPAASTGENALTDISATTVAAQAPPPAAAASGAPVSAPSVSKPNLGSTEAVDPSEKVAQTTAPQSTASASVPPLAAASTAKNSAASNASLPTVMPLSNRSAQLTATRVDPSSSVEETQTNAAMPWYDTKSESNFERIMLPEWFDGSAPHRTPSTYVHARERIIDIARNAQSKYVTATAIRRCVPGDAGSLLRLHEFLTHWGFINGNSSGESVPTGTDLRRVQVSSANKKRPAQEAFWTDQRRELLAKAVVKQASKRRKIDNDSEGNKDEMAISWSIVASEVGGGATDADCQKIFLSLSLDGTCEDKAADPICSSNNAAPAIAVGANRRAVKEEILRGLVSEVRPEVVKAATEAALKVTGDLEEARKGALLGAVAAQAEERAKAEEDSINRLLLEILDQRMQKLENRIIVLDDTEGMLEAERVALELERRDLYTARCRHWFGGGN